MSEPTPRHELIWPESGVRMAFRRIPKGEFRMGSRGYAERFFGPGEEPRHRVRIEHDFWLGETVVTQRQFALWTEAEAIRHKNGFPGLPNHPAENLTWRDAVQFCAWLTATKGGEFPDNCTLACLPTEAEWEYACLGGRDALRAPMEYYNGDGVDALAEVGWYKGNSEEKTHAVDEMREAHPFGLVGMHGNVWEWCHEVWAMGGYRAHLDRDPDPGWRFREVDYIAGPQAMLHSDRGRVLRGGSWVTVAGRCRSASRFRVRPGVRITFNGFRVCLVRGPVPQSAEQQAAESEPATGVGGRGTRPQTDGVGGDGAGGRGEGIGNRE